MSELTEHCRGRWPSILMQLDLLDSAALAHRPVPCRMCGGRDRFHFSDRDGLGIWHCRGGCGKPGGDGFDLIMAMKGIDFPRAARLVEGIVGRARWNRSWSRRSRSGPQPSASASSTIRSSSTTSTGKTTTADAMRLWRETVDPRGEPPEIYLNSRKLPILCDELANKLGASLRWHPGKQAMLWLMRSITTGEPQACLQTLLDENGRKRFATVNGKPTCRLFCGRIQGAAIMLDPFDTVLDGLHIGEGGETCLAARQYGLRPCWALGSAGAIAKFPVLDGVQALTILGEKGCAENERAIEACGVRWQDAGREVEIIFPDVGKDMNDLLMEETP
jgi:hypothetical protein